MGIGARIKEVLKDKKMTIKELAEKTKIPLNTLYSITKRDDQTVRSDILLEISTALGITTDELLYGRILSDLKKMADDGEYMPNEDYQKAKTEQDMWDGLLSSIIETYPKLSGLGRTLLYKNAKLYMSIPELRINHFEKANVKSIQETKAMVALVQQLAANESGVDMDKTSADIVVGLLESGYSEGQITEFVNRLKVVNLEEFMSIAERAKSLRLGNIDD